MQPSCTGNAILDLIAGQDGNAIQSVLSQASQVSFRSGASLQAAGQPVGFALFPVSGVLSLGWVLDEGIEVNTLGVGRDGAVHAAPATDMARAAHHVAAQLPGSLWRVPAAAWHALLRRNQRINALLCHYSEFVLARSQQALACQMKHDVESRLCHWLVDLNDWQNGRPIEITHQRLSALLGVRRTTITLMARGLQDAGIISYRRGVIEVTDLYALQQASCECHKIRSTWSQGMGSRTLPLTNDPAYVPS